MIFLLDEPGLDFTGRELILTESDPRKPGRAEVVELRQGKALIFAVNSRPSQSTRGFYPHQHATWREPDLQWRP